MKYTALSPWLFILALLLSGYGKVSADTVIVPIGQQSIDRAISRPSQGMTKNQVQTKFGEPQNWRPAVGEPPISSWVYQDFTVYFEYDHVIHSVLTPQTTDRVAIP